MIYGAYQSAAGMLVNEYRQAVLANNIANADTTGFKRDIAVFAERVPAGGAGDREGPTADWLTALTGGVWLGQTETDFSEGPIVRTNNPTDAALSGPGFFVVEQSGRPAYTRDGRFLADLDGRLMSATDGASVLGAGDAPIFVNPVGGKPTFDEQGHVLQDGAVVGQLALADFADYRVLQKVGSDRFDAGDAAPAGSTALVKAEHIEGSSSEPVANMAEMIVASRAYQLNARMVQLQDETAARMISVITRA